MFFMLGGAVLFYYYIVNAPRIEDNTPQTKTEPIKVDTVPPSPVVKAKRKRTSKTTKK